MCQRKDSKADNASFACNITTSFQCYKGLMEQGAGELKLVGLGLRSAADRHHPGRFTLCVIASHLQKTVLIIFNYHMVLNCSLINGLQSTLKCSVEIGKG